MIGFRNIIKNIFIGLSNEQEKERMLQVELAKIIINSSDPEELKNKIIKEIAVALGASRCYLIEYDKSKNNFKKISNSFVAKRNTSNLLGFDFEAEVPNIALKLKYMQSIVIVDTSTFIKKNKLENSKEAEYYKKNNIKSSLTVRLEFGDIFLGVLVVNFDEKKMFIKDIDLKFLKNIAEHISIALHLSTLYTEEKNKKEEEKLLRSIIYSISKNNDIKELSQNISKILGQLYDAKNVVIHIDAGEYKYSHCYCSTHICLDSTLGDEATEALNLYNLSEFEQTRTKENYIPDTRNFVIQNNLENSKIDDYFAQNGIKSCILLPILHEYKSYGLLIIQFSCANSIQKKDLIFTSTISNQLAIAIKQTINFEKEKRTAEKEKQFRGVIETIRSSLNIDTISEMIVNTVGKVLSADRCFIAEYDNEKKEYINVKYEYMSSDEISPCFGTDINHNVPNFAKLLIEGKKLLVQNGIIYVDSVEKRISQEEEILKKFHISSLYAVPLVYEKTFLGVLTVHYTKEGREISEFEMSFMDDIASQTAIAIHQANLYKITEIQAGRERLLRKIIANLITTFDVNEIKKNIVSEIGRLLDAYRCMIFTADPATGKELPIDEYSVYLSGPDVMSTVGLTTEGAEYNLQFLASIVRKLKGLVIANVPEYLEKNHLENSDVARYFEKYDVKSAISLPIEYLNQYLGMIIIHYNKTNQISKQNLKLVKTLANQLGIIFHQSMLYEAEKKTAQREILLRNIVETLRSTLDSEKVKQYFIDITSNYFNADRCEFADFDTKTQKFLPFRLEKLKSEDISSLIGIDTEEEFPEFCKKLRKEKNIIIKDVEKTLNRKLCDGYKSIQSLRKGGTKSDYALLVKCRGKIKGALMIHFIKEKRKLSHEELDFLKILIEQAGTALCQSELYALVKQQADRESLLRTITESIRSTLDIQKTKQRIVNIIGETIKANRCYIVEFDTQNDRFLTITDEYLSSDDVSTYKGLDVNETLPNFSYHVRKGESILIKNRQIIINGEVKNYDEENSMIEKYSINSGFIFPLMLHDELIGALSIHYTENKQTVSPEEIDLILLMANQITIAIYQAKLYEKIQVQAEREKISRNIIEILRSSMDRIIIKKLFVKNIGKFFNADRVFFADYDAKAKMYLPVDNTSEYLSGKDVESFIGFDWAKPEVREYIQPMLEKRELNIYNWDSYIKNTPEKSHEFHALFEESNTKSSYNFPVLYQELIMGYFCIEFTSRVCELSDEDINRIRSICTQAGIALYHADLYLNAQQALLSKSKLINKVQIGISEPVENILKNSKELIELKLEHEKQIDYLNSIIHSCHNLIELTKDISNHEE